MSPAQKICEEHGSNSYRDVAFDYELHIVPMKRTGHQGQARFARAGYLPFGYVLPDIRLHSEYRGEH